MTKPKEELEQKKCEIIGSKLTFRDPDTGFAIFKVKTEIGIGTAKGEIPETVGPGDLITLTGKWETNKKFGKQFKFSSCKVEPPRTDSAEGVRRLLMKLPRIGEAKARWAIKEYGHEKAWELALTDPAKLKVPMGKNDEVMAMAATLMSSFEEQSYFLGLGLTQHQINLIVRKFGPGKDGGMKVVQEAPYRLLDIDGFGFITVDSIALRSGVNLGAEGRIAACVLFFLSSSQDNDGHTWFYMSVLINGQDWKGGITGVKELLKKTAMDQDMALSGLPDEAEIERVVRGLAKSGKVVIEEGRVFDAKSMRAEKGIMGALGL
jgi:exodeoxyribonuclease V alpha subunit